MHVITKRSGNKEEFRRDKIEKSMLGAGISEQTALLAAADIDHHDGITTSKVRGRVIGAIKNKEPQAARQYELHPWKEHSS